MCFLLFIQLVLLTMSGPGCIKQLKINIGFCVTVFCVPNDFLASALCFLYSILLNPAWLIYP